MDDGEQRLGSRIASEVATALGEHAASELREEVGTLAEALVPGGRIAHAVGKVVLGPSSDQKLERAEREADRDAARQVPALRRDVDRLDDLTTKLRQTLWDLAAERNQEAGRAIIHAAGAAEIPLEELQANPRAMQTLIKGWRAMVASESEEALPLLARLAIRYRERENDPLFRSLSRVLVDASPEDLDALRVLVGHAARLRDENRIRGNPRRFPARGIFLIAHVISDADQREGVELHQWSDDHMATPMLSRGDDVLARHGIVPSLLRHGVIIDPPRRGVFGLFDPGTQQDCIFAELELATLVVLEDLLKPYEPAP